VAAAVLSETVSVLLPREFNVVLPAVEVLAAVAVLHHHLNAVRRFTVGFLEADFAQTYQVDVLTVAFIEAASLEARYHVLIRPVWMVLIASATPAQFVPTAFRVIAIWVAALRVADLIGDLHRSGEEWFELVAAIELDDAAVLV
jgi:hypothetical protein